jgi:hypothetical protein
MLTAIPTRYAGCHFRSRLEARWAVAFDSLGLRWEYEHQGYLCSHRLSLEEGTIPYLPDFWFPDLGLHGEVKAALDEAELLRLLDCAASLSSGDGGGCGFDNDGHNFVVFGEIPRGLVMPDGSISESDRLPTELHMHKGDLIASPWIGDKQRCLGYGYDPAQTIARDYGGTLTDLLRVNFDQSENQDPALLAQWLTGGSWGSQLGWDERFRQWFVACDLARSARFEHRP